MGARITVRCHGCGRTETVRASRLQACDGYCCVWWHGPDRQPAPGLAREWVVSAARGFDGWRDAPPAGSVPPSVTVVDAAGRNRV